MEATATATNEFDFYQMFIGDGALVKSESGTRKNTDNLSNISTVHTYYQNNLDAIIKARVDQDSNARTLKCIRKDDNGKYFLKLQCGKYAHPLFIDDEGKGYPYSKPFDTQEEVEALMQTWINGLAQGERGFRRAFYRGYKAYAKKKGIQITNLDWFMLDTPSTAIAKAS